MVKLLFDKQKRANHLFKIGFFLIIAISLIAFSVAGVTYWQISTNSTLREQQFTCQTQKDQQVLYANCLQQQSEILPDRLKASLMIAILFPLLFAAFFLRGYLFPSLLDNTVIGGTPDLQLTNFDNKKLQKQLFFRNHSFLLKHLDTILLWVIGFVIFVLAFAYVYIKKGKI